MFVYDKKIQPLLHSRSLGEGRKGRKFDREEVGVFVDKGRERRKGRRALLVLKVM